MLKRNHNYMLIMVGLLLCFSFVHCAILDVGQKPILTMEDVKALEPADLADFAISLYNKRADWYKDRIARWDTLTEDQQKQTVRDYKLLCDSWGPVDLYDRLVANEQPITNDLRIEVYRFIEKYLGGD